MGVGPLTDGDKWELHFTSEERNATGVGKEPGSDDDVEGELLANGAQCSAKRSGHQSMIEGAADLGNVAGHGK